MKIKRLKLSGFKSFVEPAELHIEPGLTGIVGPNGCGKSNLLEAIRWVMGESSAKSMRGAGMEDVIFAGTAKRAARSFAEVAILTEISPEATAGPIGASADGDVEVIRRIERGAGSAYRVNGRDVRAKDVSLLFADAATGAHSPALVSQGRISAVIAAKPAERRQMLEEAAGIAGLHVRRKDAEQKLRATETNLQRLDELLADMDVRTAHLRKQARQAERYRQLSDTIKIAEGRHIFARWRDAAAAAESARKEAEGAEATVQRAAEAQRAAAAWQAETTHVLATRRAAAQSARDRLAEDQRELAVLETERTALERRIAELAAQQARMTEDRDREGALARDAAEALTRLAEEVKALEGAVAEAEATRPQLAQNLAHAESTARDSDVALAQARAEQASEQAEARVAQATWAAAQARLDRAERETARIAAERDTLPDDAPLIAERDAARAGYQTAAATRETTEQEIRTAEASRSAAGERLVTAESAVAAARATLSALQSEEKALRRAVEQTGGKNRLIDRITAAPGYEHALAAALGDDLDAALGNEGTQYWLGAAPQPDDPPLPAGTQCLADHITAPAELARRAAQIAVVERDEGQPLAVGQRLVTRAGVLRRWDGFIVREGGAAAAERLVRHNRLAALAALLPDAEAAVTDADTDLTAARTAVEAARVEAVQARERLATAEQAMRAAQRIEDQLGVEIERLVARRAEIGERALRIGAEQGEAETECAGAKAALSALPDGSATATRLGVLQAESDAARTAVAHIRAELAALERAAEADRQRQSAAAGEAKGWRSRAGDAARRISEMARRAEEAEQEARTLADAPARLDARITDLSDKTTSLSAEVAQLAAEEGLAETELRKTEQAAAEAGEILAQAREARAGAVARADHQEARRIEMGRLSGERFECPAPVLPTKLGFASDSVTDAEEEGRRLEKWNAERERIGPVNLVAEQELAALEGERATSAAERDELGQAIHRLRGSIGSLNREGRQRLLAAFEAVNGHFQRLFETLFNGGQAHLELIDSDDPLEAGLEIMAQPPGKKLAALTLLSGGEQALTAVALIFGLFLTNPAPICVLDEVDAPLDDANIERFCGLLDAMTRETETRYLIVTHNAVTMSRMHRLFGVTMVEQGISRLVSVDLGGAEELLAAE